MLPGNRDRAEYAVLVIRASAAGSTAQIAEFLGRRLRDNDLHSQAEPADRAPDSCRFDVVVLGSAIHNGEFLSVSTDYLDRHTAALRDRPNWLFSVGMEPAVRGPVGAIFKRLTPPPLPRRPATRITANRR